MSTRTIEPHRLLLRYPAIDPAERITLISWLRSLDARSLVVLLADSRTETKLLAIRKREPELQHGGIAWRYWVAALLIVAVIAAAGLF
jgi:hypothetical protein